MEKTKVIIMFEYLMRVRRRSFLVTTFISPLLVILLMAVPILIAAVGSGERYLTVLDQSGAPGLFEAVKKKSEAIVVGTSYKFSQVLVAPDQDIDELRHKLDPEIENEAGKAYLILRRGILDNDAPEYYANSVSDLTLENLSNNISQAIIEQRLVRAGINSEQYLRPVKMKTIKVSSTGEVRENNTNVAASFIIFMFTFIAIIGYGTQVMAGVMEEKHSRIIEVMASSAKPFEMMMGKLIGIGLVGLTQYLVWIICAGVIAFSSQPILATKGITFNAIPVSSLLCFVIYFLLGYFLFASIYAIAGALMADNEGGNRVSQFMLILGMVPFLTMMTVLRNPGSTMALMLSLIPLFAPGIMVLRMAVTTPPLWQILLSMFLIVVAIGAAIWIAAKIYRVGILIYGKKPTLGEVFRWLRYA